MAKKLKDNDYILSDGAAWFEVGNIAIRIHKTDEGVVCDMYPNGDECRDSIASAYAFFDEAENELEEVREQEKRDNA